MNIKEVFEKYKSLILYMFFGVCTTLVNVLTYWFIARFLLFTTVISSIIAWFIAVLFAYITNRKWVFESAVSNTQEVVKEIISFFVCRLATGVVDWACMYIFVDILFFNDVVIKFLANVLVILLNYVASKLIVFKKEK